MAAPFRIYNTLTRTVAPFTPREPGKIGLYVCGMTVYDRSHVGHARAMVVFDAFEVWLFRPSIRSDDSSARKPVSVRHSRGISRGRPQAEEANGPHPAFP